ncbi:hypothetical protein [Rathayibacter soli]|uniref:hypothetical protein n=1 Tax=Rathayibacter soli TaxID=3144168 RepID=UPI0027E594A6|nr:hypothetical protein [Glaciibacter superstes]
MVRAFQPPLSGADRPVYRLREVAVELLLEEIHRKRSDAPSILLENTLFDRDSVGFVGPPVPVVGQAPAVTILPSQFAASCLARATVAPW